MKKSYKTTVRTSKFEKDLLQSIKRNYKLIISSIIGIIIPWILSSIFIFFFRRRLGLSEESFKDSGFLFRIIIFYIFTLTYELPIIGSGFWPCFIIWAVPGLTIGIIQRNTKLSLIAAMIALGTNYILYVLLVFLPAPAFKNTITIDSYIFPRLYSNFNLATLYYLLYHITFYSFAVPVLILFTIIGSRNKSDSRTFPQIPYNRIDQKERYVEREAATQLEPEIKEKKRLKVFTKSIYKQFQPLNSNEKFKEKFKKTFLKFLLNPIDQLVAALVIFDDGYVDIKEIKKQEFLIKMDKKLIGYDAMLQVTTEMLLNIAMGKMSTIQLLKTERKDKNVKVKGKLKLLKLKKALAMLQKNSK